jgi:hypothetical protein
MFKEDYSRNDSQDAYFNNQKLSDDYETPEWFWKILDKQFNFGADMACDSSNCKVKGSPLFDKGENGLYESWSKWEGMKYVFPPFSKPYFSKYIHKARMEWERGEESVVLAPLKTISVEYFQAAKSPLIYIVYPRIKFLFNGNINQMAESVCLLVYSNKYTIDSARTPEIKYLDISSYLPMTNAEKLSEFNGNR